MFEKTNVKVLQQYIPLRFKSLNNGTNKQNQIKYKGTNKRDWV